MTGRRSFRQNHLSSRNSSHTSAIAGHVISTMALIVQLVLFTMCCYCLVECGKEPGTIDDPSQNDTLMIEREQILQRMREMVDQMIRLEQQMSYWSKQYIRHGMNRDFWEDYLSPWNSTNSLGYLLHPVVNFIVGGTYNAEDIEILDNMSYYHCLSFQNCRYDHVLFIVSLEDHGKSDQHHGKIMEISWNFVEEVASILAAFLIILLVCMQIKLLTIGTVLFPHERSRRCGCISFRRYNMIPRRPRGKMLEITGRKLEKKKHHGPEYFNKISSPIEKSSPPSLFERGRCIDQLDLPSHKTQEKVAYNPGALQVDNVLKTRRMKVSSSVEEKGNIPDQAILQFVNYFQTQKKKVDEVMLPNAQNNQSRYKDKVHTEFAKEDDAFKTFTDQEIQCVSYYCPDSILNQELSDTKQDENFEWSVAEKQFEVSAPVYDDYRKKPVYALQGTDQQQSCGKPTDEPTNSDSITNYETHMSAIRKYETERFERNSIHITNTGTEHVNIYVNQMDSNTDVMFGETLMEEDDNNMAFTLSSKCKSEERRIMDYKSLNTIPTLKNAEDGLVYPKNDYMGEEEAELQTEINTIEISKIIGNLTTIEVPAHDHETSVEEGKRGNDGEQASHFIQPKTGTNNDFQEENKSFTSLKQITSELCIPHSTKQIEVGKEGIENGQGLIPNENPHPTHLLEEKPSSTLVIILPTTAMSSEINVESNGGEMEQILTTRKGILQHEERVEIYYRKFELGIKMIELGRLDIRLKTEVNLKSILQAISKEAVIKLLNFAEKKFNVISRNEWKNQLYNPTDLKPTSANFVFFPCQRNFYFLRSRPASLNESLQCYWFRLSTLSNYHGPCSSIRLARDGFYHKEQFGPYGTGCFRCNFVYSEWEYFDNVREVHLGLSPDCPFINGIESTQTEIFEINGETGTSGHEQGQFVAENDAMQATGGHCLQAISDVKPMTSGRQVIERYKDYDDSAQTGLLSSTSSRTEREKNIRHDTKNPTANPSSIDIDILRNEIRRLQERCACKVCLCKLHNVVFLPCGHKVCCEYCAWRVYTCPICRCPIKERVQT